MSVERNKVFRQRYRVADDSLERYELYVGRDEVPDFDDSTQPVATSSSLPISYSPSPADPGATVELNCVVRKRNKYNLLSFNQYPTIVEIDETGAEVDGPISTPEIIDVVDGASGQVFVFARYPRGIDRVEADTWRVYAEIGVYPNPLLYNFKTERSMDKPGVEYLSKIPVTGLTAGSTYHFVVEARREGMVGYGSLSAQFILTLAETVDLEPLEADISGGDEGEIA